MCKVMEDRVNDERIGIAVKLLKLGKNSAEEIADVTGLSVERIKEIEASLEDIPA